MASDSLAPPPSSGNFTYAIVGLVLVGATIAMFFLFDCGGEKKPDDNGVDAGAPVQRSTSLANDEFDVPELAVIDAGYDAGEAEEPDVPTKRTVRRVQCQGTLDASAIQSVVGRNRRQVRSCYERALRSNQLLQGRINVQLTVGPSGAVNGVSIGGTLRDATVNACVRGLVQQWVFPKPSGGCVMVNVPFMMTPRE